MCVTVGIVGRSLWDKDLESVYNYLGIDRYNYYNNEGDILVKRVIRLSDIPNRNSKHCRSGSMHIIRGMRPVKAGLYDARRTN